jgi:hypothetical protein
MPYITADYYANIYHGLEIADVDELNALIERASDLIDEITNGKIIAAGGIESYFSKYAPALASVLVDKVKRAVACEVEYLHINGGLLAASGSGSGGFSIGAFSFYLTSKTGTASAARDTRFAPSVFGLLEQTGLTYRGIGVAAT